MRRVGILIAPAGAVVGLAAFGAPVSAASPAIGSTTIYVAPGGSDGNPCTQAQPCATLQYAVDNGPVGATIRVAAGTYNQTVNLTKPVSIVGAGRSSTIIDGSNIDEGAMGYYGVIGVNNTSGTAGAINVRNLTVQHASSPAATASRSAGSPARRRST